MKNIQRKFQKLEEKQKEKVKLWKEMAEIKEQKRLQKIELHRKKEKEYQLSLDKLEKLNNTKSITLNQSLDKSHTMRNFNLTASQLLIKERMDQSK